MTIICLIALQHVHCSLFLPQLHKEAWWDLVHPTNIAIHEFGHYAGLSHHGWTWSNTHTAMKAGCNTGQADLRAEDINDINDHYDP